MPNLAGAAGYLAVCCLVAQADITLTLTPAGPMTRGRPVDASAATSPHIIGLTLRNLGTNPTDVPQTLSDLVTFSSDKTTGVHFDTIGNLSQGITLTSTGTSTIGSTLVSSAAIGWASSNTSTGTALDVFGAGRVGPKHDIIAFPIGSRYSNANGSIPGNPPRNPLLNRTATWLIYAPTVLATTTISSAIFSFSGTNFVAGLTAVPEPGFYGVLALAIGGLLLMVRRRDR